MSYGRVAVIAILLSVILVTTTGCGGATPAVAPTTSTLGSAVTPPSEPIVSRASQWPTDLSAAVVNQAGQLLVVGEQGVVFREAGVPATVMGRDTASATFTFALSNNGEYIAYLLSREQLIVRTVATGHEVGSVTVAPRSEMVVAAVSDDASGVVLISNDSTPEQYHVRPLPQTVTLCNVGDGSTLVSRSLSDYVTQAAANPYQGAMQPVLMRFLPDRRIVVYRQFGTEETSIYDQGKDALTRVDGLTKACAVSQTGAVVGAKQDHLTTPWSNAHAVGGSEERVTPVVWVQGELQPLEMKPLVFQEGAPYWSSVISRGGQSVAVVVGGNLPHTLWWQAFRSSGGTWRPMGMRCETPGTWIQLNPVGVSDDGGTMWGLRSEAPGSGGGTGQYPISVDTATGKWTYWFLPHDPEVPAKDFDVVALILR